MSLAKVLLATLALGAVLTGCLGARPTATPNPDPVCEAAESLQAAVVSLRRMDPSTPIDDVKIAAAGVVAAYDQLRDALGTFSEERASTLAAAMRDLENAAEQLPEGVTVEGAVRLLDEELEAAQLAWRELGSDIGCPVDFEDQS